MRFVSWGKRKSLWKWWILVMLEKICGITSNGRNFWLSFSSRNFFWKVWFKKKKKQILKTFFKITGLSYFDPAYTSYPYVFFKHYCHLRIFQKSFLNCSFKVLIMSRSSLSFQSHFNNKGKHIIFPSPGEKWTKIKGIAWIWRHLCFKSQRNEKKKKNST